MRPKSIAQFELVYVAVIVLGLVSAALGWNEMLATVAVQRTVAQLGMAIVYVPVVVGIALQLLFLYLIARRGSAVARVIFAILTGLGVVWSAFGLAVQGEPNTVKAVVDVALLILQVIALTLVFRPDTRDWFGGGPTDPATAA